MKAFLNRADSILEISMKNETSECKLVIEKRSMKEKSINFVHKHITISFRELSLYKKDGESN